MQLQIIPIPMPMPMPMPYPVYGSSGETRPNTDSENLAILSVILSIYFRTYPFKYRKQNINK